MTGTLWHVAVVGPRPEKNAQGRYTAMPEANVEFINATLNRLKGGYAELAHGATEAGTDKVVDDYAFENRVRVRQFPAYWFDPTKPNLRNNGAAFFRTEQMIRHLSDVIYDKNAENHKRPGHDSVLVIFHYGEDPKASPETKHAIEFAQKKNLRVQLFSLPVVSSSSDTPLESSATGGNPF